MAQGDLRVGCAVQGRRGASGSGPRRRADAWGARFLQRFNCFSILLYSPWDSKRPLKSFGVTDVRCGTHITSRRAYLELGLVIIRTLSSNSFELKTLSPPPPPPPHLTSPSHCFSPCRPRLSLRTVSRSRCVAAYPVLVSTDATFSIQITGTDASLELFTLAADQLPHDPAQSVSRKVR